MRLPDFDPELRHQCGLAGDRSKGMDRRDAIHSRLSQTCTQKVRRTVSFRRKIFSSLLGFPLLLGTCRKPVTFYSPSFILRQNNFFLICPFGPEKSQYSPKQTIASDQAQKAAATYYLVNQPPKGTQCLGLEAQQVGIMKRSNFDSLGPQWAIGTQVDSRCRTWTSPHLLLTFLIYFLGKCRTVPFYHFNSNKYKE